MLPARARLCKSRWKASWRLPACRHACMPARLKDQATELLQTCSWNDLRQTLECPPTRCDEAGQAVIETGAGSSMTHLQHFRSRVVAIFTRSRKMASLPPHQRRRFGAKLHEARSISQIAAMTTKALETSAVFQGAERDAVANDMSFGLTSASIACCGQIASTAMRLADLPPVAEELGGRLYSNTEQYQAFVPAVVVGAVCRAISIKEQSRLGVEHCGT